MLSLLSKYYHTLKYLNWIQLRYQVFYRLKKTLSKPGLNNNLLIAIPEPPSLILNDSLAGLESWKGKDTFCFLNSSHQFENGINWNYSGNGKLWTYNLNYFEFLSQPEISKYEGVGLIHDFIAKTASIREGLEPFPTSLRILFWIKFLTKHQIRDATIDRSLYLQLRHLSDNVEYHLLGNHLLENAFALLFGAIYFRQERYFQLSEKILIAELEEQMLPDGGHFELSPMYHHLMLYRILDAINLLENQGKKELLKLLQLKASKMLGWMEQMTFLNGQMPRVNDSTDGIAPSAHHLKAYASRLFVESAAVKLKESGYRKIQRDHYEMLIDVGQIGPDYIPGHAHSDTFNFVLHHRQKPVIVDTGITTYEKNDRRSLERSTISHNTVMLAGIEQSEVWGGFRVARRARIIELQESENNIQASHDGYQRLNAIHQRDFSFADNYIEIKDQINSPKKAQAFLHFHPDCLVTPQEQKIIGAFGEIVFSGDCQISLEPYLYATGFNKAEHSVKAIVSFQEKLVTKITLK